LRGEGGAEPGEPVSIFLHGGGGGDVSFWGQLGGVGGMMDGGKRIRLTWGWTGVKLGMIS